MRWHSTGNVACRCHKSESTNSQNGLSTTAPDKYPSLLSANLNSWSIPKNVGYTQEYLLQNSVQSSPCDCTATGGHIDIYAHPKKERKAKRHLRGIGACFICTCAIHVESDLLSLAATIIGIQSINGHFEFNLKNSREKQLITMAQPHTYQLKPNPTLSNIFTGLQQF